MSTLLMRCGVVLLLAPDGGAQHLAAEQLAGRPAQPFFADTIRLTNARCAKRTAGSGG